ncbi:YbfB/YjiJ family MFS transporter [Pseudonocardia sp. ICBG1293]|uniref:YbfB/YjiJ family MFS transporter n=1 Tax=Pseudonocardia sp. ICBG1293 TaxID=2844382 RepID=UPI001CCBB787|nr:YbfB/YjiJ family MFS transporter [Pseudonocardia sp. ICBG1293]
MTETGIRPVTAPATTRPWWSTALVGAGVIALCYGFARYAYGLFVPRFTETFDLGPLAVGVLGALSTSGYVLGLLVAPVLSARSARGTTLAAGVAATAGLAAMATAPGVAVFAAGIVVAGSGVGLASPGVAQLVVETVGRADRGRAQTWANTGTGAGLALTAFTPLLPGDWRPVWVAFALLAAATTAVAAFLLRRTPARPAPGPHPDAPRASASGLLLGAGLLGAVSAPYWTFATTRIAELGTGPVVATAAWCAIGLVGLLGGTVGRAAERFGLRPVGLAVWTAWSAGIALLALPGAGVAVALVSAGVFGAGYMALTGLCILWAARLFPAAPSRGVTRAFLALGVGQTVAAPPAGALAAGAGPAVTLAVAGALGLLAWTQLVPRLAPPSGAGA